MKIISWNVNGIRACAKKGFFDYLNTESPDIICLQETKAHPDDLDEEIRQPPGYYSIWHSAEKKGYSGVAIFTKIKPEYTQSGFGIEKYDSEGRVIMANFGPYSIFSVYFPNGQMNQDRLLYKLDFYRDFLNYCQELIKDGRQLIICGDYNTAHHPIDLARPKENETTSGFMPIEREWLDYMVKNGFHDTFRHFHSEPDQYSWWSYRTRARDRNIGWRIDYTFVDQSVLPKLSSAFIHSNIMGSDHCPVGITLST